MMQRLKCIQDSVLVANNQSRRRNSIYGIIFLLIVQIAGNSYAGFVGHHGIFTVAPRLAIKDLGYNGASNRIIDRNIN